MKHTCSVRLSGGLRLDLGGELLIASVCKLVWVAGVTYNVSNADFSEPNSSSRDKPAGMRGSFALGPTDAGGEPLDVDHAVATVGPVARS